ncbi:MULTISPECIES: Mau operon transcriptional activator MauR [Paracoccus]|jgi:DNA-binding transcriptional LysR family regulator|uniref:Mau operon transcriptional activator MauR n=1 Tax=Paracoccus TaxID=265 RepID=UPI00258898CE|nr:Mau operon transcriptional activator MauR [Paracoccus sp. (in: a-proteobacteria)]
MNWDDLRVVAAINRCGSFNRAAKMLNVEETTIARRLARLEGSLGCVLFQAVDGQRRPTEQCRALLQPLVLMEQAAEAITLQLERQERPLRNFRLTTIDAIAQHYLAPTLADLLIAEPELSLQLETSDDNVDMARWHADIAIRLGRPRRGNFTMRRVGEMRFNLVLPRGAAPEDLVLAAYPDPLMEVPEMQDFQQYFPGRQARLRSANLQVIRVLVDSGRAAAVLPDFLSVDLVGDERFQVHRLPARREIWLLAQPHLRDDPLARRVTNWCADLFAETLAGDAV